jgi:hypothetical protein
VRFVRLLKRIVGNRQPDRIAIDLKAVEDEIADIDEKLNGLRAEIDQAHGELRRLSAPFADIEFALDRLTTELHDAIAEQEQISRTIRDAFVRAVSQRPIWALAAAATRVDELEFDHLMALRRSLRQNTASPRPAVPPPIPGKPGRLRRAIRKGFHEEKRRGSGSINVDGSGSTRVRRTRRVRGHDGKWRNESYWTTVSVYFRGNVNASFGVNNRRWRPRPFGMALTSSVNAGLNLTPDQNEPVPHAQVTHLLAMCQLSEFALPAPNDGDGQ